MDNTSRFPWKAHLSMLAAEVTWGLMSPLGKDAMSYGISGLNLVMFRVGGAALLFWIASLFGPKEKVPMRHILLFGLAALLGVTFNQCLFIIGLSYTSPVNASIVTTSMPIFAMVLSFFILKEPITWMKAGGVGIGCAGAIILILTSMTVGSSQVGDIRGDLMCMGAQLAFALYLAFFNPLIKCYNVFTINKWMFLWASLYVLPFSAQDILTLDYASIPMKPWLETGFVVFFGTFVAYLLMMVGQHELRPTVVGVYNYVQPIVSVTVSLLTGLAIFTGYQAIAVVLIFLGVWLVIMSKSRKEVKNS